MCILERELVSRSLKGEEILTFLDVLSLGEKPPLQETFDSGPDIHGVECFDPANEFMGRRYILDLNGHHADDRPGLSDTVSRRAEEETAYS